MKLIQLPGASQRRLVFYLAMEEFVARLDLIGYFDMAVNLAALIDQKQIIRERHPAGLLLFVSGNGGQALDAFRNRIPAVFL